MPPFISAPDFRLWSADFDGIWLDTIRAVVQYQARKSFNV